VNNGQTATNRDHRNLRRHPLLRGIAIGCLSMLVLAALLLWGMYEMRGVVNPAMGLKPEARLIATGPIKLSQAHPLHASAVRALESSSARNTSRTLAEERDMVVSNGDLDGDGVQDTVTGSGITFTVELSGGNSWSSSFGNSGNCSIAITDIDGDGHLDTYRCDCGDSYVTVFYGDGHGQFSRQTFAIHGVQQAAFADMDGDGHKDLVYFAYPEKQQILYYRLVPAGINSK
jgi:hypothetical protein